MLTVMHETIEAYVHVEQATLEIHTDTDAHSFQSKIQDVKGIGNVQLERLV